MEGLPHQFCTQVGYIWEDAIGKYHTQVPIGPIAKAQWKAGRQPFPNLIWQTLYRILEREKGLPPLPHENVDRLKLFVKYITEAEVTDALYAIELTFTQFIDKLRPPFDRIEWRKFESVYWDEFVLSKELGPDDAIAKLNERFQQHHLPYRFEGGKILEMNPR